jgi:hypothetical protein
LRVEVNLGASETMDADSALLEPSLAFGIGTPEQREHELVRAGRVDAQDSSIVSACRSSSASSQARISASASRQPSCRSSLWHGYRPTG